MKLFNLLFLTALLCFLPLSVSVAQTPAVPEQMQKAVVNINTSDVEQLAKLPGIGKKKAQAIVDYREANGDFTSLEDLALVKGIGKKIVEKLNGNVTL